MTYTVHWKVNDGRKGYPNISAELNWSDVTCKSYRNAIMEHAKLRGVNKILSISPTNSNGKINGANYRDFLVNYLAKNITEEKEIYLPDEVIQKIVRVFSNKS